MATKKKIISGGGTRASVASAALPESKVHRDPGAPNIDWDSLTINGKPVPEELRVAAAVGLTDQMIEGRGGPIKETTVESIMSRMSVTRDSEDKNIDRFRDGRLDGDLLLGTDPLALMAERHTPAGHRHLWIGAKKAQESGLLRGVVEYKPVIIDDPENKGSKKRVTQGGMFLASVPEELAVRADKFYAAVSDSKLKATVEKVQETSNEIMHGSELREIANRRGQRASIAGLQVDDSDAADAELERAGMVDHEMAGVGEIDN